MNAKPLILAAMLGGFSTPGQAQYKLADGNDAAPLEMFQECSVCPEMIALPLGEFTMGAPAGESRINFHRASNGFRPATPEEPYIAHHEGPVHQVRIDIPIAMGRNEVTYGEWMACVDDGGCNGHIPQKYVLVVDEPKAKQTARHPVIDVSYLDAVSYTEWLNEKVGASVYRLPTEAEWEYAARAGTQTPFAQGEEVTSDQANFHGRATGEMLGEERPDLVTRGKSVRVDELNAANPWGLRHMSGNVRERTMSCWTDTYLGWRTASVYLKMAQRSPCDARVSRGGAYWTAMDLSRVAVRGFGRPSTRGDSTGFRVLRELGSQ